METFFARNARAIPLGADQRSIIVGSLLGDGTLLQTTAGWCFRVHHGLAQRELVDWKYRLLATHVRTAPKVSGRGVFFRTVTHPELGELREQFYCRSTKRVPLELLERDLDALGLAVWVMDDGARDGYQIRLNTQCFIVSDVKRLASLIEAKFKIEFRVNFDKGRPRLRSTASTTAHLVSTIGQYIIPSMRYKLPL